MRQVQYYHSCKFRRQTDPHFAASSFAGHEQLDGGQGVLQTPQGAAFLCIACTAECKLVRDINHAILITARNQTWLHLPRAPEPLVVDITRTFGRRIRLFGILAVRPHLGGTGTVGFAPVPSTMSGWRIQQESTAKPQKKVALKPPSGKQSTKQDPLTGHCFLTFAVPCRRLFSIRDQMYVCMYVCMYVIMYVRDYARMFSMHVRNYACMWFCIYVIMQVCMSVCMYVCMYVCM